MLLTTVCYNTSYTIQLQSYNNLPIKQIASIITIPIPMKIGHTENMAAGCKAK